MATQIYAYYPGCTLHSTAKEYDRSARAVCQAMGIELRELQGWTCCGASSAHSVNHLLATALPARDLQAASETGLPLAVACALCFSRLRLTNQELTNQATRELVSRIIGKELKGNVEIVHLLQILESRRENISVVKPLQGLKVACYYGCLLVRPQAVVGIDDAEDPQLMDRLMVALGAETIDWGFKAECCGASLPLTCPEIVMKLSHRILSQAKQGGADCIATACPMCHSNLDTHQERMKAVYKDDFGLPVFYFTQLVGLALGFSPKQMLLERHFTDPLPILKAKGLV